MKKPQNPAEAHIMKIRARRKRKIVADYPDRNPGVNIMDLAIAEQMEKSADAMLALPEVPGRGTGGELVPPASRGLFGMAEAVREPDYVSMEASIERIELAEKCKVFNMALDTAETIGANNAPEQMLAHQMAAAHRAALELLAKSSRQGSPVEMARLANSSARLMEVFQKAMLTLNKVRTGGQQVVTVQHVQVGDGGQAIINGNFATGGNNKGGKV